MKIDDSYLSHPNKKYNEHITNIEKSFSEDNHKIVAQYHDLGKISDEFQYYISLKKEKNESEQDFEKRRSKHKTTHTLESAYLYFCNHVAKESNFLSNFFAILKHHSSLGDIKKELNEYLSVIDTKGLNKRKLEKIASIAKKADIKFNDDIYEFIDFFDELIDEKFYQSLENFFLFKKRYSRLVLSDKYEAIFSEPYRNLPYLSKKIIEKYIEQIHNKIEHKQKNRLNIFRTKVRETIFKNFEKEKNFRIYLIKAPTGVGKTFIALELALKIAMHTANKKRIITAIPFTSIIDQTHTVYEEILGEGNVLKYHHLTKQVQNDEEEQFSQKIFYADIWHEHFIVTTFNQLLNAIYSNRNKDNLRLETLRDSVVIIDEVQNISRTLLKDISFAFDELGKRYNIHFIIMSATMPQIQEMFENSTLLSEDFFYTDKKSRYELIYKEDLSDYEKLKESILAQNTSVLCVVNTIEKAKILHETIDSKDCYLLTTHQIPKHRVEIIQDIQKRLKEGKKTILIATQLIEAGVDLDFDVGFREFAPFASIIQMAGRVNREEKKGVAKVYVFDYIQNKSAPYHIIDLQEDKIKNILQKPLKESELLENLDEYFLDIKNQTNSINLKQYMENLEFQTLFEKFNENFMPNQPWKVSLFIEQEEEQFNNFIQKREEILKNAKNSFEARDKIKNLEKDLAFYTILVSQNLIKELIAKKHPIKEKFGRYILPFGSEYYSKERGFNTQLTAIEESFS